MRPIHGSPYPLGASWDGNGVNFAVYSEHATRIEVCLFDDGGNETRIPLRERTAFVWHGYLRGLKPGQKYGLRAHGPYDPEKGLRFNPNCLLLDPYAVSLDGPESFDKGLFAYELGNPDGDLKRSDRDARGVPLAVVIDPSFDWTGDRKPNVPFSRSVIYETHVRGLTKRHPEVPEAIRGTYAAVASEPVIRHLKALGITAVELMPVHAFVDDSTLRDKKLRNYWGYNTIAYLAPETRYRTEGGDAVREFKSMVKALHSAGLEVILDVVYNHTAEGNHLGPTFSFKGIDNPTYYRLVGEQPRFYFDYTGTGNSLNVRHPQTLELIMDSLRYWIVEMHVDGFRFDLAATLARSLHEVDQLSSFFTIVHQDPVISRVKLIAEPWDVGEGGYQVGNFPVRWTEWNGRYRDTMRAFWKGSGGVAGEVGYRLSGSSDLYQDDGRRPYASVNFITAHDGFTMNDLVSYEKKHNEANGEDNRDGNDNEHSWNFGTEGPSNDPNIQIVRRRSVRNLMATLLLSQGTPMLCGGDEMGRTQNGNNNAYCQDNETSWYDWNLDDDRKALITFTSRLIELRDKHPGLRRSKFFKGRRIRGTDTRDIMWFRHDGAEMSDEDWKNAGTSSLGMYLSGKGLDETDEEGNPVYDENLLLVLNASDQDLDFVARAPEGGEDAWEVIVDTALEPSRSPPENEIVPPDAKTRMIARSLKLLRRATQPVRESFYSRGSQT